MKEPKKPAAAKAAAKANGGKSAAARTRVKPSELRSKAWFDNPANADMTALYLERTMNYGLTLDELQSGKPIIGIAQSGSDLSPCNRHHIVLAERIREGIREAGGIAFEFPLHPIQETCKRPTASLDRNLAYLGLVEVLFGYPLDAVVLTTGCDKTTPSQIMAAATVDLPAIVLSGGPMLNGWFKGERTGSGTIVWKAREMMARGEIAYKEFLELVASSAPSAGHCNTMGTASTMNSLAEALGMSLPGSAAIPAPYRDREENAYETGKRIVDMVWEDLTPARILTHGAFLNAIVVAMAMGCSTNAVVHILAMARRAGHPIGLDDFDAASRKVPVVANIRPSGDTYLMEDFYYAGGLLGLMSRLTGHLDLAQINVTGETWGQSLEGATVYNDDVIRPLDNAIYQEGALAVLRGNLAPDGCVIKPSACAQHLLRHTGPALVFDDYAALKDNINREDLDVTADHVLVLRNAGPQGGPGMPEWGMLPIPTKLVKQGVRDMIRISDARMSGTSYGACILHVAPESYVGGPLALVRTGDKITVDVPARTIRLEVADAELAARRAALPKPAPRYERGYGWMFSRHIKQANDGCDFDFLETSFGKPVGEPDIY